MLYSGDTNLIFRWNKLPENPALKRIYSNEYVEIGLPLTAPQGSSNFRFLRDGQALKTQERPSVWSCKMGPKVGGGHVTGCTFCHNTPTAQIPAYQKLSVPRAEPKLITAMFIPLIQAPVWDGNV